MPFYCGKRSAGICLVLGPKKPSTYSSEYASGFFEPAVLHLPAAPLPRNEGLLGQTPSGQGLAGNWNWDAIPLIGGEDEMTRVAPKNPHPSSLDRQGSGAERE